MTSTCTGSPFWFSVVVRHFTKPWPGRLSGTDYVSSGVDFRLFADAHARALLREKKIGIWGTSESRTIRPGIWAGGGVHGVACCRADSRTRSGGWPVRRLELQPDRGHVPAGRIGR